jgi:hypothetical protein
VTEHAQSIRGDVAKANADKSTSNGSAVWYVCKRSRKTLHVAVVVFSLQGAS